MPTRDLPHAPGQRYQQPSLTGAESRKHGNVRMPGGYAGALHREDDGERFEEQLARVVATLREQPVEAVKLDAAIEANLMELGHGEQGGDHPDRKIIADRAASH